MAYKSLVALTAVLPGIALGGPALAQAAAESAVILSGTGQGTGEASRSVGAAAAGGIGRASDAIAATNARARGGSAGRSGSSQGGYVITGGDADALEGTDAPLVQTASGASIRVSGRLIPAAVPAPAKPPAPAAPAEPPKP